MRRVPRLLCVAAPIAASIPAADLDIPTTYSVRLKPSSSPFRKPSVWFSTTGDVPSDVVTVSSDSIGTAIPTYRIASPTCDYYALRIPLLKAGFRRIPDDAVQFSSNIVWGKSAPIAESPNNPIIQRNRYQKFNHFPHSHKHLGCKRGMASSLRSWDRSTTSTFTPETYFYPSERQTIEKVLSEAPKGKRYIWKPARGSCGRGIMMCRAGSDSMEDGWRLVMKEIDSRASNPDVPEALRLPFASYVVQEYIEEPLLVGGRKLDLRLYVGVTSMEPLVAYLHAEGLVRFAAEPYNPTESANDDGRYRHLTNFSIGRKLEAEPAALDLKWSLSKFEARLDQDYGKDHPTLSYGALMRNARRAIVETLLSSKKAISLATDRQSQGSENFVELFGFDIMFDQRGTAWLIEVNTLPSLESSSTMDYVTKSTVTTDLLNLSQLQLFSRPSSVFGDVGLLNPIVVPGPSQSVKDLVNSEPNQVLTLTESERLLDLQMRLTDESKYRGKFERIFPAAPFSHVEHHRSVMTKWDEVASQVLL